MVHWRVAPLELRRRRTEQHRELGADRRVSLAGADAQGNGPLVRRASSGLSSSRRNARNRAAPPTTGAMARSSARSVGPALGVLDAHDEERAHASVGHEDLNEARDVGRSSCSPPSSTKSTGSCGSSPGGRAACRAPGSGACEQRHAESRTTRTYPVRRTLLAPVGEGLHTRARAAESNHPAEARRAAREAGPQGPRRVRFEVRNQPLRRRDVHPHPRAEADRHRAVVQGGDRRRSARAPGHRGGAVDTARQRPGRPPGHGPRVPHPRPGVARAGRSHDGARRGRRSAEHRACGLGPSPPRRRRAVHDDRAGPGRRAGACGRSGLRGARTSDATRLHARCGRGAADCTGAARVSRRSFGASCRDRTELSPHRCAVAARCRSTPRVAIAARSRSAFCSSPRVGRGTVAARSRTALCSHGCAVAFRCRSAPRVGHRTVAAGSSSPRVGCCPVAARSRTALSRCRVGCCPVATRSSPRVACGRLAASSALCSRCAVAAGSRTRAPHAGTVTACFLRVETRCRPARRVATRRCAALAAAGVARRALASCSACPRPCRVWRRDGVRAPHRRRRSVLRVG